MKRLLVALMVLVTLIGISAYADALVLCQDSRGVVYVRYKCDSNWDMYPLDPVALGLGLSVAVHGTVAHDGSKISGEGFTSAPIGGFGPPYVRIKFDRAFQEPPDCTATSLHEDHYCDISLVTETEVRVICATPILTGAYLGFSEEGGPFSFICVY